MTAEKTHTHSMTAARLDRHVNVGYWESTAAFRAAASSMELQESLGRYPDGAVASPHIFTTVVVPGICGD